MTIDKNISQYINPLLIESNQIGREILVNNPYRYVWTSVFPKVKSICLSQLLHELDSNINTQDEVQTFKNELEKFELWISHIG